jgi:hypothetical protein
MRKLGEGQSVVFCIPEEIQSKIQTVTGKAKDVSIDTLDVLSWAIWETHAELRRSMPLWAVQGARFQRQKALWAEATSSAGIVMSSQQAERFQEDEAQTLERRYKPFPSDVASQGHHHLFAGSKESPSLAAIWDRCEKFDSTHVKSSALQEEQERELSQDIEKERQIERPHPVDPESHHLHPDVEIFVATGRITSPSSAFIPAFQTVGNTSAANHLDMGQCPSGVLVTADYTRTVKLVGEKPCADSYQRPIQWILTCTRGGCIVQDIVIISPYEAQELMPNIKQSTSVSLHLYAPRPNLAFPVLDELKLYTVPSLGSDWQLPRHLRLQLNLFAGQLYFSSFQDYQETCEIMSLAWKATGEGTKVEADGFIPHEREDPSVTFTKSPVAFLKIFLTKIRRDCEGIDKTHWGKILGGEILKESDFKGGVGDKGNQALVLKNQEVEVQDG